MVHWLVEQGVEVTPHELILAAYTGNAVSLAALLERYKGSVPDLRTESGKSLLHLACEGLCFLKRSAEEHVRCVDLVLQRKVPVDQTEPKQGRSCLQNYVPWMLWEADFGSKQLGARLCEGKFRHHFRWMMYVGARGTSRTLQRTCGPSSAYAKKEC